MDRGFDPEELKPFLEVFGLLQFEVNVSVQILWCPDRHSKWKQVWNVSEVKRFLFDLLWLCRRWLWCWARWSHFYSSTRLHLSAWFNLRWLGNLWILLFSKSKLSKYLRNNAWVIHQIICAMRKELSSTPMNSILQQLPQPIILDGGLATELERKGLTLDKTLWSSCALTVNPELVGTVHLEYLQAGARIISTDTYQASTHGFEQVGIGKEKGIELMKYAVDLAYSAIQKWSADGKSEALIAASMGPYGAHLPGFSTFSLFLIFVFLFFLLFPCYSDFFPVCFYLFFPLFSIFFLFFLLSVSNFCGFFFWSYFFFSFFYSFFLSNSFFYSFWSGMELLFRFSSFFLFFFILPLFSLFFTLSKAEWNMMGLMETQFPKNK